MKLLFTRGIFIKNLRNIFLLLFFPLKNGDIAVYIFNFVNTLEYDELPDDDGFTLKNLSNVVTWQANNLLQNSIQLLLSYIPAKYNKQIFPPFYFISFFLLLFFSSFKISSWSIISYNWSLITNFIPSLQRIK